MNTYSKFCPNVFLAKCSEKHEKGEYIDVTTQYGKENECIVFNLIYEKEGYFYYSIVRADGFNVQQWAANKADKYEVWAGSAEVKAETASRRAFSLVAGIPMGQPILVGHHSEKRHRRALDDSWNALGKSVALNDKAEQHEAKASYWRVRAFTINLSMPESMDYYEFLLEQATRKHQGLKDGTIERSHGYSLTYAKNEVNDAQKKLATAKRLWQ